MTLPDYLRYELRGCAAGYNLDPTDTVRVDELTNAAADRIEELEAELARLRDDTVKDGTIGYATGHGPNDPPRPVPR